MNSINKNGRELAVEEASQWLVRLHEESVSDADLEAWGDWMAKSPANARAFDDVSALWDVSASVSSESLDHAIRARSAATSKPVLRPRTRRRWLTAGAMAAACGLVALGVVKLLPGVTATAPEVFATEKGERRQVLLADGSAVTLDADSRLTVELSGKDRELMLERGRAHFAVAHDASRPFRVQAGGIVSQAVGTRFSVGYLRSDRVAVVVDEGRVRVGQLQGPDAKAGEQREVGRNERIRYSTGGGLEGPQPVNADLAMSWKEGSVVYQSEQLATVIEDLNRYSRVPLRLEDASMGRLLVTGRWESASIDNWIDGLANALHLDVVRRPDVILLATRKSAASGLPPKKDPQASPADASSQAP